MFLKVSCKRVLNYSNADYYANVVAPDVFSRMLVFWFN
jgi:hypothetical protein